MKANFSIVGYFHFPEWCVRQETEGEEIKVFNSENNIRPWQAFAIVECRIRAHVELGAKES